MFQILNWKHSSLLLNSCKSHRNVEILIDLLICWMETHIIFNLSDFQMCCTRHEPFLFQSLNTKQNKSNSIQQNTRNYFYCLLKGRWYSLSFHFVQWKLSLLHSNCRSKRMITNRIELNHLMKNYFEREIRISKYFQKLRNVIANLKFRFVIENSVFSELKSSLSSLLFNFKSSRKRESHLNRILFWGSMSTFFLSLSVVC
jgi:hypothetical protein